MSNIQGSEKTVGRKVSSVYGWRSILERFALFKRPIERAPHPILSWIHVYVVGLYMLDYCETVVGTGLGIQELNPLVANLMNLVGNMAFPLVFIMVLGGLYYIVGRYGGSPRLIMAILLVVGGNETANVSMNLLYILHRAAVLR